jgi:hypothetical protein
VPINPGTGAGAGNPGINASGTWGVCGGTWQLTSN